MTATGSFEIWDAALETRLAVVPHLLGEQPPRIQDVPGDTGLTEVALGLDEAAAEHVAEGNHLRALIGDEIVTTAIIEAPIKRRHVAARGAAAQIVELSCRGRAVILDEAPVDPPGGLNRKPVSTQRPFTWSSPECDTSADGWTAASVIYPQMSVPYDDPVTHFDPPWFDPWLLPVGWYDPTAALLWCRPLVDGGHPVGDGLFVGDITLPADGLYLLQYIGDDYPEVYVDGLFLDKGTDPPGDTFTTGRQATLEFTAGNVRIGLRGRNYERPTTEQVGTFGAPNKGYVAFAIFHLADGPNTVLTPEHLVAHSDASWRSWDLLANPEEPAPTWGKIALQLLSEGIAAGTVPPNLTPTFTATTTSTGAPWVNQGPYVADLDSATVLSVLRAGFTGGCIEWRISPDGLNLDAANPGELGVPHPANYTADGGGLLDLLETTL